MSNEYLKTEENCSHECDYDQSEYGNFCLDCGKYWPKVDED